MNELSDYLTTDEAAEIVGLTPAALRRRARAGELGAVKRGGIWWLQRDEVTQYAVRVQGKALNDPTRGR